MTEALEIRAGTRFPPGAAAAVDGVNFSIYSRHATRVWLRLYRRARDKQPIAEIELDPKRHRTLHFWHVFVAGAKPGWLYTWRVDGPNDRAAGLRFDPARELLDPWAELVAPDLWRRADAVHGGAAAIRAQIAQRDGYDWQGDQPLAQRLADTVIYEMHVRGFTRHPSSQVEHPGTFAGVIEKIPHLRALGITAVELLPVNAFDRQDVPPAGAKLGLVNYWGYSPYAYFALEPTFAAGSDARTEFRDMVKALHKAGIAVILDMVLNHTAEAAADGPTIGFRGFANDEFYLLDPEDQSRYLDFTGCGNTVSCNHPLVARFIQQCLEYWVREMHVDGFRIDLASVLSRGMDGEPLDHPPVIWALELSEALANTALIAEPWDATGFYQVGNFPGWRWAEWNGLYRDAVRRFLRGDPGSIGEVATRIAGSSDLYAAADKRPQNGVNFVTCHDGFTLHDLVAYDRKHNHANAEGNHDGRDDNFSWNSGAEGPTSDVEVVRLREQRARNFMTVLALSQGVPMLLAGDEVLRTQEGNNNAYCQDNGISWLDWSFSPAAEAMLRFTREILSLRKRHASLRRTRFIEIDHNGDADLHWCGETLAAPDWSSPDAKVLCFTLKGTTPAEPALHVMMNMSIDVKDLPLPPDTRWRRIVDTTLPSPDDIIPTGIPHARAHYLLPPHAIAVFESSATPAG
jgi:glycogen operon protein